MSGPVIIGAEELGGAMSVGDAAAAIEADVRGFDTDADPARWATALQAGELLVMPCERPGTGGVKLATVAGAATGGASRIGGVYLLWETATLSPLALIDGPALTALRTAALSLFATRLLAPAGARTAVVFGTGPQGWSHVRAMAALPEMERVGVVGRRAGAVDALVAGAADLGVTVEAADPGAVADADVICTATTSATPVFDGALLRPGAHVNAVGSHTPDHRELDEATMSAAAVVAVDTPGAWEAAGELAGGAAPAGQARLTLRGLVERAGRPPLPPGITVFKSVGASYADLAVATALYRRISHDPRKGRP